MNTIFYYQTKRQRVAPKLEDFTVQMRETDQYMYLQSFHFARVEDMLDFKSWQKSQYLKELDRFKTLPEFEKIIHSINFAGIHPDVWSDAVKKVEEIPHFDCWICESDITPTVTYDMMERESDKKPWYKRLFKNNS